MQLSITDSRADRRAIVPVVGEVDIATGPTLRDHLNGLIADGETQLVVDATDVGFMDSTGLGILVGALKRIRQAGGDLVVVTSSAPVRRIFEITGLLDVFKVSATLDDLPALP